MSISLQSAMQRVAKVQGVVGRLADKLPTNIQIKMARVMGYKHDYPELAAHLKILLAVHELQGGASLLGRDPVKSRRKFSAQMAAIQAKPTAVAAVWDFKIPGPAGELSVRHYVPAENKDAPLLVFFHGGGFVVGDLDTHDEPCRLLCHYGNMHVLSVNYRLAPENPAPAAAYDCLATFEWAKAHAVELGVNPAKVAVGGDSAGGNLAAVVSQLAKGGHGPAAQLLIYPTVDQFNKYDSHQRYAKGLFLSDIDVTNATQAYVYAGGYSLDNPIVTPMMGDVSGVAPALVITAGHDVLRDEGEAYAELMQMKGVPVTSRRVMDQAHGFINITPVSQSAKQATIQIAKDFRQLLNNL